MRMVLPGRTGRLAVALALVCSVASAQTKVTAPKNSFTPAQDVEVGQKAAAEVRQQMPLLQDESIDAFVQRIGRRLVQVIPDEFRHPEFRYQFEVVNASDINAFALPGGPMFVNRGMITAARTEGEVAGVMAHELSHVFLRHGTAQASKAQKYQIGQVAGQILGAIVGGTAGAVIAQGSQFGLGVSFLRYSRDYEKQADIMGAQVMARAGYDPRDMASMFQTIEKQSKSRAPQWMSSHPNPGNRQAYIRKEAQLLNVDQPIRDSGQLAGVQAELRRMPAAPTTEQIMARAERGEPTGGGEPGATGTSGRISSSVEPPSPRFRTVSAGDLFEVSVPENWREMSSNNSVRFAPEGAFGSAANGQNVFTHGVEMGFAQADGGSLHEATDQLIRSFQQANPRLRAVSNPQSVPFAGRQGLRVQLRNVSDATGNQETIVLNTAMADEGTLFFSIGVAPSREFNEYAEVLQEVNRSVRLQR